MQHKWGIKRIADSLGFQLIKQENKFDCKETLRNVMLALDGELSPSEEKSFLKHLNECSPCLEKYEIEKSFKKFLTEKLCRHNIPPELVDQIKFRITGLAGS